MARYFATNTLARGQRSNPDVTENTTAGRFNSTFGSSCILIPASGLYYEIGAPFDDGSSSITGTVYLRFDYMQSAWQGGSWLLWVMNGATNAYRMNCTTTATWQMQYWNTVTSAWVNWGPVFSGSLPAGVLATMVIKLTVNSGFEVRVGGTLIVSHSGVPTNGVTAVTAFRWGSCSNNNNNAYVSQIMAADYDIGDAWILSKLPNGNGTYTDGSGSYTDVDELGVDDSDAIGLPAVGNKKSFTKASVTIPSGYAITGLQVNSRCRVAGGVVANAKLIAYNGGTKNDSGNKSPDATYNGRGHLFTVDPSTSSAFGQAGFNTCEFGLEAS